MKSPSVRKAMAAQISLLLYLAAPAALSPALAAGLPVIDGTNLSQNVISAIENVAQTLKQIQQYQTQLQQYQNMLQNTAVPATYIWDSASRTMNDLRGAIDTLQYYRSNLGNIELYLGQFRNRASYRNSPCFAGGGCSNAEWMALRAAQDTGSEAQKMSTDALFRGLDRQQDALEADALQLQRLQSGAQGASGQMQAIGYANQLASQQATQLLQIRALLVAQQNVIATRYQAQADREALESAASERFRKSSYLPSPIRSW